MQLARCQAFASACTFVRFGSLTTAWLAEYDCMGRKSTPFFFYFHHIIRTPCALLASCYHPRCLHQPHRHPHRHHTCRVASYCTTSLCPCESCANNSRSSLIFSPCHICNHPCRRQPHRHSHRHRTHRVALYYTTSHCPCECYANNSRSSLIFSLRHICYCHCCQQPQRHLH